MMRRFLLLLPYFFLPAFCCNAQPAGEVLPVVFKHGAAKVRTCYVPSLSALIQQHLGDTSLVLSVDIYFEGCMPVYHMARKQGETVLKKIKQINPNVARQFAWTSGWRQGNDTILVYWEKTTDPADIPPPPHPNLRRD